MDELLNQAKEKGMFVVDQSNSSQLMLDYEECIREVDKLIEIIDPMETPYLSKYKARELLDNMINQFEATKTVLKLEGATKKNEIAEISVRVAKLKLKSGLICWEVEEPHNAEIELNEACEYYYPGVIEKIKQLAPDINEDEMNDEKKSQITFSDVEDSLHQLIEDIKVPNDKSAVDSIQTLNLLGILWSGRMQFKKSFLYLLSANKIYHLHTSNLSKSKKEESKELDDVYTHNLFYLAQAYGNIGNTKYSSFYCQETLQRQLLSNLQDIKSTLEWIKNCQNLSDFYLSMKEYNHCALCLSSAESIMLEKLPQNLIKNSSSNSENQSLKLAAAELEAELNKRWVMLDTTILKRSYEFELEKRNSIANGIELNDIMIEWDDSSVEDFKIPLENSNSESFNKQLPESSTLSTNESLSNLQDSMIHVTNIRKQRMIDSYLASGDRHEVNFFENIPVTMTSYLHFGDIQTFDDARKVFIRAAARIEAAKKYYLLDGHVTDHCFLLQEHSKLFHYISIFETDLKRKLAMDTRRVEMLSPLLKQLNASAYEALHKQISYEVGETALSLLETKLDMIRKKNPNKELTANQIKKSDAEKCNEYCKLALIMFSHFSNMYAKTNVRNILLTYSHFETLPLSGLMDVGCTDPDDSQIGLAEIRPFLNSHFLCCRVLSKIIPIPSVCHPPENHTQYLVACLKRYEWIANYGRKLCKGKNVEINELFKDELIICDEMKSLLPAKIDRMKYLGEGGLTL